MLFRQVNYKPSLTWRLIVRRKLNLWIYRIKGFVLFSILILSVDYYSIGMESYKQNTFLKLCILDFYTGSISGTVGLATFSISQNHVTWYLQEVQSTATGWTRSFCSLLKDELKVFLWTPHDTSKQQLTILLNNFTHEYTNVSIHLCIFVDILASTYLTESIL